MTIFDHLNSILFSKKRNNLDNIDDEPTFIPFMLNRWITMYSSDFVKTINDTTNRYTNTLCKKNLNIFYTEILPKCRFKRINYIKKVKKETDEEDDKKIESMAKYYECSQREIKQKMDFLKR